MHRWRGQSKGLLLRGWRAAQLGHHIWRLPGLLVGQGHARLLLLLRLLQCLQLEHLLLHLLLLACRFSWWNSCTFRLFVRILHHPVLLFLNMSGEETFMAMVTF